MTRETKVGLVVAASFASLVGVVVWQKMKKSSDDANPVTIAVAPGETHPEPKTSKQADPKKDISGVAQAELRIPGSLENKNVVKDNNPEPVLSDLKNKDGLPALPQLPPTLDTKLPAALPKLPDPTNTPDKTQDDFLKQLERAKLPVTPVTDTKLPDPGKLPPIDQFAQAKDPKDKEKELLPPTPVLPPPIDAKNLVDPKAKDPVPPPIDPKTVVDPKGKEPVMPPPPPVAVDVKSKDPVPVDLKKDVTPPPPLGAGNTTKNDLPPIGNLLKDQPPLGGGQTPPPTVQTPGAKINVTSGETYRVQANDTLPDISRRAYGSDKYAPAILAFNSQYNPDKAVSDNLKTNPRLVKDMGLVLPTREFLSSRYAHLIQEAPVSNDPPPISIKPPTGLAQTSNPNAAPPIQAKTPDPTRRYRVPDQGQYIIEIARQTLGNPSRWSEILRLNPSLRTEYPIPGGTELQLPAN